MEPSGAALSWPKTCRQGQPRSDEGIPEFTPGRRGSAPTLAAQVR